MKINVAASSNAVSQSFTEADFYTKSKQPERPVVHEFDKRTIDAWEFVYQLFAIKYGEKAKPYFTSTLRIPGDPHYRKTSLHSFGSAADGNWTNSAVEDEIVLMIGYDVETNGPINQELRRIGVGEVGTYYHQSEGTFIHLGATSKTNHYREIPRLQFDRAKELHREFMELVKMDATMATRLGIGPSLPPPLPKEKTATEKVVGSAQKAVAAATDIANYTTRIINPVPGEDPLTPKFRVIQISSWVSIGLGLIALVVYLVRSQ